MVQSHYPFPILLYSPPYSSCPHPDIRIMSCGSLSFSNSPTYLYTLSSQQLLVFSCSFWFPSLFLILSVPFLLHSFCLLFRIWLPQLLLLKRKMPWPSSQLNSLLSICPLCLLHFIVHLLSYFLLPPLSCLALTSLPHKLSYSPKVVFNPDSPKISTSPSAY